MMFTIVLLISSDCFIPFIGELKINWVGLLVCNGMLMQCRKSCLVGLKCSRRGSLSQPSIWEDRILDACL